MQAIAISALRVDFLLSKMQNRYYRIAVAGFLDLEQLETCPEMQGVKGWRRVVRVVSRAERYTASPEAS